MYLISSQEWRETKEKLKGDGKEPRKKKAELDSEELDLPSSNQYGVRFQRLLSCGKSNEIRW